MDQLGDADAHSPIGCKGVASERGLRASFCSGAQSAATLCRLWLRLPKRKALERFREVKQRLSFELALARYIEKLARGCSRNQRVYAIQIS